MLCWKRSNLLIACYFLAAFPPGLRPVKCSLGCFAKECWLRAGPSLIHSAPKVIPQMLFLGNKINREQENGTKWEDSTKSVLQPASRRRVKAWQKHHATRLHVLLQEIIGYFFNIDVYFHYNECLKIRMLQRYWMSQKWAGCAAATSNRIAQWPDTQMFLPDLTLWSAVVSMTVSMIISKKQENKRHVGWA